MKKYVITIFCALLFVAIPLSGRAQKKDPLKDLEQRAAESARKTLEQNLAANEIEMIEYRRKLMGRPGLHLYVIFFNDIGQPLEYFVTSGKCTSSNKRLLPPWKFERGQTGVDSDGNAVYGDFVMPTASEDGTHGESDTYVYCKTADGKYKQWNGKYYISDHPLDLTIKPFVIDVSSNTQQQ